MPLNKNIIKENFSKSAANYDQSANIQRQMLEKVFSLVDHEYQTILDVGCGTGALVKLLADKYPSSQIVGIDFAPGMIKCANLKIIKPNVKFAVEDGEKLPFEPAKFDLVVSSAALQWMDYRAGIKEAVRVLKPGGKFIFATFGPRTLQEGRRAGLSVNTFPAQSDLEQTLQQCFKAVNLQSEVVIHKYANIFELFKYLKEIGARYPASSKNNGLLTKNKLLSMFPVSDSGIEVSYEILYGVCN
ncbi:MAG: malonyl-ACP O-methyltransferase BioC [Candidatus Margulisbacteria bacterium]|nr:malonyl-ACP O-methyltransferase BioC [Candidatus Margulisiibacteriota bacterium]